MRKISSIQGLRVIAFTYIFLAHSNIDCVSSFTASGASGVMFFFVVSGFLESYNHYNSSSDIKISKERMLSIVCSGNLATLLSLICWLILGYPLDLKALGALVVSLLFFQCYLPPVYYHYMFSTVTWFIGDIILFYFLTPYLIKLVRMVKNKKVMMIAVVLFRLIIEVGITLTMEGTMEHYYTYIFPLVRLIDYFCGVLLGAIFIENNTNSIHDSTVFECVSLAFFVFSSWLSSNISIMKYGVLLLIPVLLLIYTFSFQNGKISEFFGLKSMCTIGGKTKYYFVFNIVALHYTIHFWGQNKWVGALCALLITALITELYILLEKKLLNRILQMN